MRRALPSVLFVLLLVGAVAYAKWPNAYPEQKPRTNLIGPKAPTKLTAVAAGEVHVVLSATAVCIRISCTVSAAYLTGQSGSPPTATADSNQLPANTVEKLCLSGSAANDYFSAYLTSAGSCYVAELNDP